MTIEQKAKAYDEALNWMRELYPGLHGATKEEAEHYFPELRESEDEKMMNQLHSWMMEFGGAEEYAERVFQWLKGLLEKQKEQKPAEWSEEDEEALREVKLNFELNHDNMTPTLVGFYERFFNKLKFLRPQSHTVSIKDATKFGNLEYERGVKDGLNHHWKPSEEQMGALNYAYCELFKREDVGHNILGPLQKLLDDLKKLM